MKKSEFIKECIEAVNEIRITYIRKIFVVMDYVGTNYKESYDDSDIMNVVLSVDSIII